MRYNFRNNRAALFFPLLLLVLINKNVIGQSTTQPIGLTAGEIDSKWTDATKIDFREWTKTFKGKMPISREAMDKYLEARNF